MRNVLIRVICLASVCAVAIAPSTAGAQTVSVSAPAVVPAWDDYASRVLADPWDMNQRTDIGWMTWGVDAPTVDGLGNFVMTGKRVSGGVFSGTPVHPDPNFFLLDPWPPGVARLNRNGSRSPIETGRYNALVLKMRMATTVFNQPATGYQSFASIGAVPFFEAYWSNDTPYNSPTTPNGGSIGLAVGNNAPAGLGFSPAANPTGYSMEGGQWVLHVIRLDDFAGTQWYNLATKSPGVKWRNSITGATVPWGGSVLADSLRIDPLTVAGLGQIDVDYARLVSFDASSPQVVSWTNGNPYDIVLSTHASCDDDGNLSNGYQYTVAAYSQYSGFPMFGQMLPPGTYYVGIRAPMCGTGNGPGGPCSIGIPNNGAVLSCSTSPLRVSDAPLLTFTSPHPEGSTDDFAAVQLGNAWDFGSTADLDLVEDVTGGSIVTIPAERPDGTNLGNVPVYRATNTTDDPKVLPFYLGGRGLWNRIDTERYRLLSMDFGIDHARDLYRGSVGRLIWHVAGEGGDNPVSPWPGIEPLQAVTEDIILRHMAKGSVTTDATSSRFVLDRIQADLRDRVFLPLEHDLNGSLSRTGWRNECQLGGLVTNCSATPTTDPFGGSRIGIDEFRFDPHEFLDAAPFYLGGLKLAAHERVGSSFTVSWDFASANPSVPGLGALDPGNAHNWVVRLYAVPPLSANPMEPATRRCSDGGGGRIGDTTLDVGSYVWGGSLQSQPSSGAVQSGDLLFVCAGLIGPGQSSPQAFYFSQWPIVYDIAIMGPRLFLDKSTLRFSAVRTSTGLSAITPSQSVTVAQTGSGAIGWQVEVRDTNGQPVDYVQVAPASGAGSGVFSVSVVTSNTLPLNFSGASAPIGLVARLSAPGAENSPQYVQMYLTLYREGTVTTAPPIGQVDTPLPYLGSSTNVVNNCALEGANTPTNDLDDCVSGSVAVTGWAIDDVGVDRVEVFRQCVPFEEAATPSPCVTIGFDRVVHVGEATFIPGARPDVEAVFPTYPNAQGSGWGFLILTNFFPNIPAGASVGGQGYFDLYVYAVDSEGQRTLLGRSTVDHTPTSMYVDNGAATAPFGAIDTPTQGQIISGSTFNVFGWALTPPSGANIEIPVNGSTITAYLDGVPIGTLTYNQCRDGGATPPLGRLCADDVAGAFSTGSYRNLIVGRGAIGYISFDTTALSNGLHTIGWGVTDSAGRASGIGSRFITVLNTAADPQTALRGNPVGPDVGGRAADLARLAEVPGLPAVRRGFATTDAFRPVRAARGEPRHILIDALDRLEVALPMPLSPANWDGYLVRNGQLVPLPEGAHLAPERGKFYWQTIPGWIGDYDLMFVRRNANGTRETLPLRVTFAPTFGKDRTVAGITAR